MLDAKKRDTVKGDSLLIDEGVLWKVELTHYTILYVEIAIEFNEQIER